MLFWILAAALTAIVTYWVTKPLLRPPQDLTGGREADLAVYKDQLSEIEADAARGALAAADAVSARSEVARRMLRAADAKDAEASSATLASQPVARDAARTAHIAASIFLPLAALGLYLNLGSPGLPGQPLEARLIGDPRDSQANDLVAKVEAALRKNPQDGRGWDVIAPVYLTLGRFDDATTAYATAIRIQGESASRLLGYVDARIRADNGVIGDDARKALARVRELAPDRQEPRIWLAMAKEQDGDKQGAIADYRAIVAESAANAPWRSTVEQRIAALERPATDGAGAGSPSPSDMAAFEAMTPEQRQAKITEMVDGLAAKLRAQPNDRIGWQRLIRAYAAMGRREDAMKAASDARTGLAGDQAEIRQFEDWIKQVGLAG